MPESKRPIQVIAISLGTLVVVMTLAIAPPSGASRSSSASMIDLQAIFVTNGLGLTTCPPGTPSATDCYSQTARAAVRGLGPTTLQSLLLVDQNQPGCEHLKLEGTLATGEGTAAYTATSGARCIQLHQPSTVDYSFASGGGSFVGAAGTGTIVLAFVSTSSGDSMKYGWNGVLNVPGYSFDTTAPRFSGIHDRVVIIGKRARRARVRYAVSAHDDIDAAVSARCRPASGTWFLLGRTTVKCRASDVHANVASARFHVFVKHRRG